MGKDKVSPKSIVGDLAQVREAAIVLNEAVYMIGGNRKRLETLENAVLRIDRQLDSLERRYSELLFTLGEMKC